MCEVHVAELPVVCRVSSRIYFLQPYLILFYTTRICSILEYGSPPFHHPLTCMFPECGPRKISETCSADCVSQAIICSSLETSCLPILSERREANAAKLFDEMCTNQFHCLHILLPTKCVLKFSLKEQKSFICPVCKTERCKNSFPLTYVYMYSG